MNKLMIIMAAIFFAPGFTFGNTVVIEPGPEIGQDTYAQEGSPDYNFSDYESMRVDFYNRSFLQFTQLNGYIGYDIDAAALELWYVTGDNPVVTFFCRVLEPWDEDTLTWNNQPEYSTTDYFERDFSIGEKDNCILDVTSMVRKWCSGEWQNHGWCMTGYYYIAFCTSNYYGVGNGPKLTITGPNLPPLGVQPTSIGKIKSLYSPQQVSSLQDGRGQFAKHEKRRAWTEVE
jgi:hypothetical protein